MTAQVPEEDEETVARYRGVIIIEWPPPGGGPYEAMLGTRVNVFDSVSGKQVTTCINADVVIHVDASRQVTADLTLFADEDGEPLLDGTAVVKDGEPLTGVFPFLVGEMRVRAA